MATPNLDAVLRTDELDRRPTRRPDHKAESEALRALSEAFARAPEGGLDRLIQTALALCGAESGAMSVAELDPAIGPTMRWRAAGGRFSARVDEAFAEADTIASAAIAQGETVLLLEPGRVFAAMRGVEPPVAEALVTPIFEGDAPVGALWVANHAGGRRFDAEDRRLLESLASLAAVAWRAQSDREAVQEGEAFLRLVTDRLPVRVAYIDREFRFRFMNDAYEQVSGIRREESLGRTVAEATNARVFNTVRANLERALAGETHTQEFDAPYSSGTRTVQVTYVPDVDPAGGVRGVVVQAFDMTEQRRAEAALRRSEARQAFLLALSDRLRLLSDPDEIKSEGTRLLGERLGASRVGYAEVQPDSETSVVARDYARGVPSIEGAYQYDDYGPELLRELRLGRVVIRPDIAGDLTLTEAERAAHAALDLGSTVNVPLMKGGRLVAVLFAGERTARVWTADDLILLDETAERIWSAAERTRAEAERRSADERYRAIFESIDEGFCIIEMVEDKTGRFVDFHYREINPAFERLSGLTAEVVLSGRSVREIIPEYESVWIDLYGRVARTGEPASHVSEVKGLNRWFEVTASRVGGPGNRLVAVVFNDITARQRAEAEIAEERARLDHILERAGVATFDWNVLDDRLVGNVLMSLYFGVEHRPEGGPVAPYFEAIHADDRPLAQSVVERALDKGTPYEMQQRVRGVDGRERRVLVRADVTLGADGTPLRLSGIVLDVTERVLAEEARRAVQSSLDAVLAAAEVGMWNYDPATGSIGADANLAAMFGLDPEAARTAPAETFIARIHPDDQAGVAQAFGRAATEGSAYDIEYRTVVEGRVRWLVARGFAERDEAGRVVRMPGAVLDITSVKLAEEGERAATETLARSVELFRTVFEQAPDDAILTMDLDRTITAWNPAAERICGWSAQEAIGQPADIIFTPEDCAAGAPEAETGGAAARGKAADERWHIRKDGSRFWGSGTMNSLHDAEGRVRGYLKVFRDATERQEAQQRLRDAVEERTRDLQEAVREAEAFNYSISHDLRTPLRHIASTSGILLEEAGDELLPEHRDLLVRQSHNANRLGKLIDELLRLSRLARAEVDCQPLDMTALARSVAEMENAACAVEVQEGMRGEGDPSLVRTVLQNLIGNACKFSPAGGTVAVGETDGVFWVRDQGVGFDMRFVQKIFLPFERLVHESEFPGTGIGLANVERIVRRHGGKVWAESEPGRGATFFFTLG